MGRRRSSDPGLGVGGGRGRAGLPDLAVRVFHLGFLGSRRSRCWVVRPLPVVVGR
jgi:hypothetical protein